MRAYRDVANTIGIALIPVLDVGLNAGSWLVHSEAGGKPHCNAIVVNDANTECVIYEGDRAYEIQFAEYRGIIAASLDQRVWGCGSFLGQF